MKSAISLLISLLALFFASQFSSAGEKTAYWKAEARPADITQVSPIFGSMLSYQLDHGRQPGSAVLLHD